MTKDREYKRREYTYAEFKCLAVRKAFVQWYPSRIIERLIYHPKEGIFAQGFNPKSSHPIHKKARYFCKEIHPNTLIKIGDLFPDDKD